MVRSKLPQVRTRAPTESQRLRRSLSSARAEAGVINTVPKKGAVIDTATDIDVISGRDLRFAVNVTKVTSVQYSTVQCLVMVRSIV